MHARGLPEYESRCEAYGIILVEYLNGSMLDTDPRVCAWCGKPNLPLTPTLPFGVGNRHAWLHQHCRDRWAEARHKAAIETLTIMGIVEPPKDEALR